MLCPQTNPIIMCHEGIAASAMADATRPINLEGATGVLFVLSHATGTDVDLVLTLHEGATALICTTGTNEVAATFPVWVTANCATSDLAVLEPTEIAGYTVDAGVLTGTSLVQMYFDASKLTSGRTFVSVGSTGGGTGLVSLIAIIDGVRYQQTSPPTAIA